MKRRRSLLSLLALLLLAATLVPRADVQAVQEPTTGRYVVAPGDTWVALSWRFRTSVAELQSLNPHPNPLRQPVIGDAILVPEHDAATAPQGTIVRPFSGGLLAISARYGLNPWALALLNNRPHPYRPVLHDTVMIPVGTDPPRELPSGFHDLELSSVPARPGRAIAWRGKLPPVTDLQTKLGAESMLAFVNGDRVVALGGTGAFYGTSAPELLIQADSDPGWVQPWRFVDDVWDYDQVTLTGAAAAIDQAAIVAERERLSQIWAIASPLPQWGGPFQLPLQDYLSVSSNYGARRSYNGGPYRTYHEGVDFSAYRGTPVFAVAGGTVVLAEELYVRGGAVIIDHGLGVFSGYYHMSAVHAAAGQPIQAGELLGEVGSSGLSSGNHLHWDLLVGGIWVDAAAWREDNMACWILSGWGTPCAPPVTGG